MVFHFQCLGGSCCCARASMQNCCAVLSLSPHPLLPRATVLCGLCLMLSAFPDTAPLIPAAWHVFCAVWCFRLLEYRFCRLVCVDFRFVGFSVCTFPKFLSTQLFTQHQPHFEARPSSCVLQHERSLLQLATTLLRTATTDAVDRALRCAPSSVHATSAAQRQCLDPYQTRLWPDTRPCSTPMPRSLTERCGVPSAAASLLFSTPEPVTSDEGAISRAVPCASSTSFAMDSECAVRKQRPPINAALSAHLRIEASTACTAASGTLHPPGERQVQAVRMGHGIRSPGECRPHSQAVQASLRHRRQIPETRHSAPAARGAVGLSQASLQCS